MSNTSQIMVFAQLDHAEAMRVAAGLTIFGHSVNLVFADRPIEENEENLEQAELLDLSGIEPFSLVKDENIPLISNDRFERFLKESSHVISF